MLCQNNAMLVLRMVKDKHIRRFILLPGNDRQTSVKLASIGYFSNNLQKEKWGMLASILLCLYQNNVCSVNSKRPHALIRGNAYHKYLLFLLCL